MIIYRGVSAHQRPAPGWFYHPDIEFARQFTQSGQFNEILKAELQDDAIYYHDPLPYGGDPDEVDGVIELAKAAGKYAVACDEGGGYEPSILVLKSALAKRVMRLLGRCTEMDESTSLVEVHYSDAFPKAFNEFYAKWKGKKSDPNLYVRFDNGNTTDSLSRGASSNPSHSDPIGTYAYPLKYVIDHPGDIWYGHNSKFIKVIRNKAKNKLLLSSLEWWRMKNLFFRSSIKNDLEQAATYYPDRAKGVTGPGKIFMSAVQMNFDDADPPRSKRKDGYKAPVIRSSEDQTRRILSLGIDALEDRASRLSQASINDREPEQIVWLRPTSFEILDTFRLSDPKTHRSQVILDADRIKRKIAALVAGIMGDGLKDHEKNSNDYWTTKERRINIEHYDSSLQWRMQNLKMGQKKHKMFKKSEKTGFKVNIDSERGKFAFTVFSDDKIKPALGVFAINWKNSPEQDSGECYSLARQKAEEKAERDARWAEERIKEDQRIIEIWPSQIMGRYNMLAKRLNLPLIPPNLDNDTITTTYRGMLSKDFDDVLTGGRAYLPALKGYEELVKVAATGGGRPARIPQHLMNDVNNILTRDVNESEQVCRAVDLDGTLAHYDGWKGEHHIGEPVPKMLDNVKTWLKQGDRVVIFTARAKTDSAKSHIKKWLSKHGLPELEITNVKTPKMDFFYDDKAVGIAANTGLPSLSFVKMFE